MTKAVTTERAMKFGVEIEFSDIRGGSGMNGTSIREKVAQAIKDQGVRASAESLSHSTASYWKVSTDSSCGYEVVSPILTDLVDLEKVCKALETVGAKVNKKCGIHVHHDAQGMTLEKIKNVYRLYNKHQDILDGMMPQSRRADNNRFCKGISDSYLAKVEGLATIERALVEIGGSNEGHYTSKRYYKVNFASYVCYGTLEFRQHSASIEFEKISNWVWLTHKMMERSAMRCNIKAYTNFDEVKRGGQLLSRFCKELGISGTDVAEYISKRVRKFRAESEIEQIA